MKCQRKETDVKRKRQVINQKTVINLSLREGETTTFINQYTTSEQKEVIMKESSKLFPNVQALIIFALYITLFVFQGI